MSANKYCPYCKSKKPMWKAGKLRGWNGYERQRYLCKSCKRYSVNPLESK